VSNRFAYTIPTYYSLGGTIANRRPGIGIQLVARSRSTCSRRAGIRRTVWGIWRGRPNNLVESNIQLSTSLATRRSLVATITRSSRIRGRLDIRFSIQMIHMRRLRRCLTFDGRLAGNRNMVEKNKNLGRIDCSPWNRRLGGPRSGSIERKGTANTVE
jgi:hypothetical protein